MFIYWSAIVFCLFWAGPAVSATLNCDHPKGNDVAQLKQAPAGQVKRVTPHRLQLQWVGGVKTFQDKPPFDDSLGDGETYRYCGFDTATGLHLIASEGGGLFTGILFDSQTGKTINAGKNVQFSADHSQFFATEQPNGLDGEQWLISTRSGQKRWSGFSFLTDTKGNMVALLDSPHWSAKHELTAQLVCLAHLQQAQPKQYQVTLKQQGQRWIWQPTIKCPAQP